MITASTSLRLKKDSAANWNTYNPVLLDGEIAYDSTNKQIRIGDGVKRWNDLNVENLNSNAIPIIDDLDSDNVILPLSSKQGKVLNELANVFGLTRDAPNDGNIYVRCNGSWYNYDTSSGYISDRIINEIMNSWKICNVSSQSIIFKDILPPIGDIGLIYLNTCLKNDLSATNNNVILYGIKIYNQSHIFTDNYLLKTQLLNLSYSNYHIAAICYGRELERLCVILNIGQVFFFD